TVTAGPGIVQPRKRHNREFSIDRQRAIESPALIGGARELSRSGLTDRRARPFVHSGVNKLACGDWRAGLGYSDSLDSPDSLDSEAGGFSSVTEALTF